MFNKYILFDDLLGISFFQQSTPELISFFWMHVNEFIILRRKAVVNENLHPSPILPKKEPENP